MHSIWDFFVQTLTVSLSALLLLFLKRILADKLPPRWQYYVWGLLALRILLPAAAASRYILAPVPVLIEMLKAAAEQNLSSAYASSYIPIDLSGPLPLISALPVSITDWLFVLYAAGILFFLFRYAVSYVRLRCLLQSGMTVDAETAEKVRDIWQSISSSSDTSKAQVNCPLRIAVIAGLPSAFICGVFRPVLALPADAEGRAIPVDEKVLLHELLHLRYKDALQSMFWSLLRCLHWCNPFLWYVFNRIGNDMEALCDQRVLERLEGEERRAYGQILLSMTNDRYPRAFGTTSLSNGGRNISRRISCIARFRKYPAGMALVSVCIAVMLVQPLFFGTSAGSDRDTIFTENHIRWDFASSRLNRCTTLAGAVDTFAKGIINSDWRALAAALPFSEQKNLHRIIEDNGTDFFYWPAEYQVYRLPGLLSGAQSWPYAFCNLRRTDAAAENIYLGELLIALSCVEDPDSGLQNVDSCETFQYYTILDEDGECWDQQGYMVYPLTLTREKNCWTAALRGMPSLHLLDSEPDGIEPLLSGCFLDLLQTGGCTPGTYTAQGESGSLRIICGRFCYPQDSPEICLDAQFSCANELTDVLYTYEGTEGKRPSRASLTCLPLAAEDAEADFSAVSSQSAPAPAGQISVSTDSYFDGRLVWGSGGGETLSESRLSEWRQILGLVEKAPPLEEEYLSSPAAYKARIFLDRELAEVLTAKEVTAYE